MAIGKADFLSIVPDAPKLAPLVGMSLGVFKLCVAETTDEPELVDCGTHGGIAGHPDPLGNTDTVTVTCIVPSCDYEVSA